MCPTERRDQPLEGDGHVGLGHPVGVPGLRPGQFRVQRRSNPAPTTGNDDHDHGCHHDYNPNCHTDNQPKPYNDSLGDALNV